MTFERWKTGCRNNDTDSTANAFCRTCGEGCPSGMFCVDGFSSVGNNALTNNRPTFIVRFFKALAKSIVMRKNLGVLIRGDHE